MATSPEPWLRVRLPNESDAYRAARDALLREEVRLRQHAEEVAALRRELPLGGKVPEDYVFTEWDDVAETPRAVRLSELFSPGKDTLFLYSFMFIPDDSGDPVGSPCPSCTSIIDAVSGQARHVTQRVSLAVSAKAPIRQFRRVAEGRGWRPIRLLSAGASTYNRDYLAEDENGAQRPIANVFVRRDGQIRHFWSSELFFVPGARHADFMWPMWGIFDCTPDGRGTDDPKLRYS